MDSLKTIQKFAKVGKVLSKIVFIICIVSLILLIIGGIGFACIPKDFNVNGQTFKQFVESIPEVKTFDTIYVVFICAAISLITEIIIAKKSINYFKKELADGTPFTYEGAAAIKKLGKDVIILPIIANIISIIIYSIAVSLRNVPDNLDVGFSISISLGICFIILSYIFKYGADILNKETKKVKSSKK